MRSPHAGAYVLQEVCEVAHELCGGLLRRSFELLVERHQALRTRIETGAAGELRQMVYPHAEIPWVDEDWTAHPSDDQEQRLSKWLAEDSSRGFDFAAGVPARVTLIKCAAARHTLVFTCHHVLLDGRSLEIALQEWFAIYDGLVRDEEIQLPQTCAFSEHLDWLASQDMVRAERYWQERLAGLEQTTALVTDRLPSFARSCQGMAKERTELSADLTRRLHSFVSGLGITVNTLMQAAWALVLSRTPEKSLLPWLREIRAHWMELRDVEYTPADRIAAWAGLPAGMPLFDTLMVYGRQPVPESYADLGVAWRQRRVRRVQRTDAPLTLAAYGSPLVTLEIIYDTSLFAGETMARLAVHLRTILESFLLRPEAQLEAVRMLPEAEEQIILHGWNSAAIPVPAGLCAHNLFEEHARKHPANTALEDSSGAISYDAVDRRANKIAHLLLQAGAGPDQLAGVCISRSPETVIAVLAVLKAGAAFLPLDPQLPQGRLESMLRDAGPKVLLCREAEWARLRDLGLRLLNLDRLHAEIAAQPGQPPPCPATPDNAAYAIYTSGSTGKPKAVVMTHRSLVNHTLALPPIYGISPADRRLQFASIGSDVFIAEIFNYLSTGATLVFAADRQSASLAGFLRDLEDLRITVTGIPSSWWNEWMTAAAGSDLPLPRSLRAVIAGMERVNPAALETWKRLAGGRIRWFNAYGPTETCTATVYESGASPWEGGGVVPIGRPVANTSAYVLDPNLRPLPVGIPGELFLGGAGVARGYWNSPELTSSRFLPDPFTATPAGRIYRTGDLVYLLPDGNLVFVGRCDRQVKLRGHRIELEEIESVLSQHPDVRQCAVTLQGGEGHALLVAYVSPKRGAAPSSEELRLHLSRQLPEPLIPAGFLTLPELPLTPAGKIDRRSLPEFDPQSLSRESSNRPSTPTEKRLAELWQNVLGVANPGTSDHFFQLGGDSLRATRLIVLIQKAFGKELPLAVLLRNPTIGRLATLLDQ
ncbi:MAG: amino acid adenylation domain-containing protein [Acidobacteria bacterium]|nr:amino acid adenylation domain-containing protein [Acidobacteriota bacterium]